MGVLYSSTCRDPHSLKQPSRCRVSTALYWCKIEQLVETLRKLCHSKLTVSEYIDAQTLSHLLPFSLTVGRTLLQPITEPDGFVSWRSCLGGLAFCVSGRVDDRLHFLLSLYGYQTGSVSRYELRNILVDVLLVTEQIFKCELGATDVKRDVFFNVDVIVDDILNDLFNYQTCSFGSVTLTDIQTWAAESSTLARAMFRRDSQFTVESSGGNSAAGIEVTASSVSTQSRYRWSEVNEKGEGERVPASRCKHAACLWDGYLYVYGGREGNVPHKDLWRFHINLGRWEQMLCKGDRPMLLQEHTMVAYKGKLYVFGGDFSYNSSETPLWIFDTESRRWTKPVYGEVVTPCGVRGHTAVVCNNAMHVYGGYQDLKGSTGQMWSFDLEENMWHLAHTDSGPEGDGPGPRHAHSAIVHDQAMWVFGGMCDLQPKNDFWKWSFGNRQWTRIRYKQGPPELQGHSAVKVADGMVIYGGDSNGAMQGDIWKYSFGLQTWSKVHFHPPCPLARLHHCAVAIPGFALNSSSNDRSLSVPHVQGNRTEPDPTRPNTSPHSTQRPESPTRSNKSPSRSRGSSRERASSPSYRHRCATGSGRASPNQLHIPQSDILGSSSDSDTGSRSSDSASRSSAGPGHKFRNRVLPLYGDVSTLLTPHQFPDQPLVADSWHHADQSPSPAARGAVTVTGHHDEDTDELMKDSESCVRHLERELSAVSDINSVTDDTHPLVLGSSNNRSHDMKRSLAGRNRESGIYSGDSGSKPAFRVASSGFENPVFSYSISNDSGCHAPWTDEDGAAEPVPVKRQRSDDQNTSNTCWDVSSTCTTLQEETAVSRRSRARSTSMESLLSTSQTIGTRALLQREVLPGTVKSGSLESLMQGMGGVQLKYINIDEDECHMVQGSESVANRNEMICLEDTNTNLHNQSTHLSNNRLVIGGETCQSNHAFQNPFLTMVHPDVSNNNEGIDMTVFKSTKQGSNSDDLTDETKQYIAVSSLEPNSAQTNTESFVTSGKGQNLRPLKTGPVGMLRESSFTSNSASSGYHSQLASERNTPHRLSRTSHVSDRQPDSDRNLHLGDTEPYLAPDAQSQSSSKRDFSSFVTQPDRERISNRGRDMTVYMFVIGGKEESRGAQSLISSQPINMWKLQIY